MQQFDIPVVLIIFRRAEKSVQIVSRIAQVKPRKMYIISDEGRTDEEKEEVNRCRRLVEEAITWDCTVKKNYATENRGVYERIGLGALWVFSKERKAIFLEDDNLPELSFFGYCSELLDRYETRDDILWICGTNYLEEYKTKDGSDYVFTRHMHPCGWASWSDKFTRFYDKDFSGYNVENLKRINRKYKNKRLYRRDLRNWKYELKSKKEDGRFTSWDYQMCFSLRLYEKIGIVPRRNQIKNIGVDNFSAHGGKTFDYVMTERFCGMDSLSLTLPLKHPATVEVDEDFESLVDKIVIPPIQIGIKIKTFVSLILRKILRVNKEQRLRSVLFPKRNTRNE